MIAIGFVLSNFWTAIPLVLEVGPNRCPFLLEVDGINCSAVFANRLTFYDNDRRICAFDNALLVTDVFLRSDPLDVCRIRGVRAVSEDELLERYASLGKLPPLPPGGVRGNTGPGGFRRYGSGRR